MEPAPGEEERKGRASFHSALRSRGAVIELPKYGYPVAWIPPANIVGNGGEFFRPALGYEQSVKWISVDGSEVSNTTSMLENHRKDIESGRF